MPQESCQAFHVHTSPCQALREEFDRIVSVIERECPDELERCCLLLLDLTGRRDKHLRLTNWMTKRLEKAAYLTPVRLAGEARYYFRWPMEMMPWLIETAQRVKARVRMRRLRSRLKHDRALASQEQGKAADA